MIQNLQINIWFTQYSFWWDVITIQRFGEFGRLAPKTSFQTYDCFHFLRFISHFTTQSTSLLWVITCTHILYKGEVCTMIFPFPFPFESKVDFKYWLRGTLRENILMPDRQRSAYISFDLLIVEVILAPNHPLFCFPNENTNMIYSAFLLIVCFSNHGGGIILTLNNKKVAIAFFFHHHGE